MYGIRKIRPRHNPMHGASTPLPLPRRNIRDAKVATTENWHPTHRAQDPPAEPQRMRRARMEDKETGKRRNHAKKTKSEKKQEGTNKRCPGDLTND